MLTLDRQELSMMSKDDVITHVRSLESNSEIKVRLHNEILAKMSKTELIAHAIGLQWEIGWQQVQAVTSGGAG